MKISKFNRLHLAQAKRVAIQTVLVEGRCPHNTAIRDIVTKYASHCGTITKENLKATMRIIHERPTLFIDAACGWYWVNIAKEYQGMTIAAIYNRRHEITAHYSKHLFN